MFKKFLITLKLELVEENLETEDIEPEEDHWLFIKETTSHSLKLWETFQVLKLLMLADLTSYNLLQEDMSEDSSFGLKMPSRNLTTSSEPINMQADKNKDTFSQLTKLLTQILEELLTPMKFKLPLETKKETTFSTTPKKETH